jgi:hypothetical protein
MQEKNEVWMVRRTAYLTILLVIILTLMMGTPVKAMDGQPQENLRIISFGQQDLDQDNRPELAMIMADYMDSRYRIVVCDQGNDMQSSDDWRTGTDFTNDIWLFQTENGDQTKLIIRFTHSPDGYTAELFDDVNDDGTVSYERPAVTQITITESQFPTVKFIAQQPWILSTGDVNYLVRILIYRPLYNPITSTFEKAVWEFLPDDGRLAMEDEVVDKDGDGIPDYELMLAHPDVPRYWYPFLTRMNVSINKYKQPAFKDPFFWPYLGFADPKKWTSGYLMRQPEDLTPPVQVDWQTGRIKGIAEFLPVWGRGDSWDFFSRTPLVKGTTNSLDWERFAFYCLSDEASATSTPDVVLRVVQPDDTTTVQIGSRILHFQKAALSWNQRNPGKFMWDYKLDMAGLQELPPTIVPFKDFALREVPFNNLLGWYTSREWAYATFVAAEDNPPGGHEGIWEGSTLETSTHSHCKATQIHR